MAIPREHIHDLPAVTKTLTAKHLPMGADPDNPDEATIVQAFKLDAHYLHVPRQFGLDYCTRNRIPFEDHTSAGHPVTFPRVPAPRDYQAPVLDEIVDTFDSYYDFIFKAHTGWGKTIGELIVAARLGRTTLVIVDQTNLMDQWLEALEKHFGMTVDGGHVGIIQGKRWDYQGKMVCIAMLQTLSQKTYPQPFYDYFGHVVFDEVHTIATPTFQVVMMDFPAMTRTGVSATPKDGTLAKLLWMSLGKVRVAAEKEHDLNAVYYADHDTVYSWYANISPKVGRIITEVSEDGSRNLLLAELGLALYETGRDTLLLSDRIEQLTHMRALLHYMGANVDEIGVYAGYHLSYAYAKNPTPKRNPNYLTRHEDGNVYFTPISLQLISKRVPPKRLREIKATAGILAATFGMCKKGFDEPRLRAGVDLTPRSKSEQIHGRILRDSLGKIAIWATIRDTSSYRLLHTFANRVSDYLKSNARLFYWTPEGEIVVCDPKETIREARDQSEELKSVRIEQRSDGRYMLVTKAQENARKRQHVKDIVSRVRSRRPG